MDQSEPIERTNPAPGLLNGIRILDLTHYLAGPYCTMLLADLGADVIKIERPGRGDGGRGRGPVIQAANGKAGYVGWLGPNRNKKSVTLNPSTPEGRSVFLRLVAKSDAVVENLAPGTLERWDLGFAALAEAKSNIVLASITGFGQPGTSPYWQKPAFGQIGEALSGITSRTGGPNSPPLFTGMASCDMVPGLYAAFGIAAALHRSRATGIGAHLDVAQMDCLFSQLERLLLFYDVDGVEVPPGGERAFFPTGVLEATDGFVMYAAISDQMFQALCEVIGEPGLVRDPKFATGGDRERNLPDHFHPRVRRWAAHQTKSAIVAALELAGVPAAPVQSIAEAFHDPHIAARRMYVHVEQPGIGPVPYIGNPVKVSGDLLDSHRPAPELGQHTEAVLGDVLGMAGAEIESLRRTGAI